MNDKTIARDNPRFIIVTDHESILASDTKTRDTLDIAIKDLPKHFSFFLPWAGIEKARYQDENPADRLISATSIYLDAPLITADKKIRNSKKIKTIW
jgi:predicted nucleic acid-binding protein